MVKTTTKLTVVFLVLVVSTLVSAADIDIPGSKHDLSVSSGFSASYTTCYICHSPHTAMGSSDPLWLNKTSVDAYTQYNSTESGYEALKGDGGVLVCLSCHDGTFADRSVYIEAALTGEGNGGSKRSGKGPGPDHPVNIVYFESESDPDIRPAISEDEVSDGETSLVLYNGRVQCGSCHDVHKGQGDAFLRVSNEGSQLCLVCHLK